MTGRVTSAPRLRSLHVALLAALLLIIGGTHASADPSQTPFKIAWSACENSPQTQCGTLKVPLDWSKPSEATISLAIARRPAKDPQQRVGTLFFNPGGPGDTAAKYIVMAESIFTPALIERFDLVGMDPRGMENSSQVRCTVPVITPEVTLFPKTEQQFQQLLKHNREVGLNCLDKAGDLVRHMDTVSVARDHEALRQALGENKINWLGISYGTQLAANYAQLYPTRTRAMVLDAPLEHSLPEVHQVATEIIAAEDSFNRFADWCPSRRPARCAAKTYGQSSIAWSSRQIRIRFRLKVRCGQSLAQTSGWARRVCCGSRNRRSLALICRGLGCRGRYRRRSTVTGPPSRPAQQESHSMDTTACWPTRAWTTRRKCIPMPRCSSGSNWAASSLPICKAPQKRGRPTSASTGLSSPPTRPRR